MKDCRKTTHQNGNIKYKTMTPENVCLLAWKQPFLCVHIN